jgi:hypothetical protein
VLYKGCSPCAGALKCLHCSSACRRTRRKWNPVPGGISGPTKSKALYYWQSVSQSVCLGIEYPCDTCDQILFPVGMLLSEICSLVSFGRRLWREDGSAICSVITQWCESLRTRNHTLPSHLRLPQPAGPGSRIYTPQEQGGPVIPPGTGFPLCHLLGLAGLRWRYSNPPRTWRDRSLYI